MRQVLIPDIGLAKISKRKGMRNIRISISADGQVRINMPRWVSYRAAEKFARSQLDWIDQQRSQNSAVVIKEGDRIGRTATVTFDKSDGQRIITHVTSSKISIKSNLDFNSQKLQRSARAASEKSLKLQAEGILTQRVQTISQRYNLNYKQLIIKKLTSRWGSCSSKGVITLSYYLVQLPDELIDYVIAHELVHTEQMNHSRDFWRRLEGILAEAKQLRKKMRAFRPALEPRSQANS